MGTFTISISDYEKEQLKALSHIQKRPIEKLLEEALRRYLAAEQLKALRKRTVTLAKAEGYLTDEDIFRVVS